MKPARLAALGTFLLVALLAWGAGAATSAAIVVDGDQGQEIVTEIAEGLPEWIAFAPSKRCDEELRKRLRLPLGEVLSNVGARRAAGLRLQLALRRCRRELAIVAAVEATPRAGLRARLLLVHVDGDEPVPVGPRAVPTGTDRGTRVRFWSDTLASAIAVLAPDPGLLGTRPRAASAVDTEERRNTRRPPLGEPAPPPVGDPRSRQSGPRGPSSRLAVDAAFELGLRRFEDRGENTGAARRYDAQPIPGARLRLELYPGLLGEHLGIEAGAARSFGVKSETYDGRRVDTALTRIDGAFAVRWLTAQRRSASAVTVLAGYGYREFAFAQVPAGREIPSARYHLLRIGAGARVPFDRLVLSARGEYDRLVHIAPLGTVTPASQGNGFAFAGEIGFQLLSWLVPEVDVSIARYSFDLDTALPSAVVDQYLTVGVGMEARW